MINNTTFQRRGAKVAAYLLCLLVLFDTTITAYLWLAGLIVEGNPLVAWTLDIGLWAFLLGRGAYFFLGIACVRIVQEARRPGTMEMLLWATVYTYGVILWLALMNR